MTGCTSGQRCAHRPGSGRVKRTCPVDLRPGRAVVSRAQKSVHRWPCGLLPARSSWFPTTPEQADGWVRTVSRSSPPGRPHEIEQARRHPPRGHRARRGRRPSAPRAMSGGSRQRQQRGRPCRSTPAVRFINSTWARPSSSDGVLGVLRSLTVCRSRTLGSTRHLMASASPLSCNDTLRIVKRTAVSHHSVLHTDRRLEQWVEAAETSASGASGRRGTGWPATDQKVAGRLAGQGLPINRTRLCGRPGLYHGSTLTTTTPRHGGCQPTDEVAIVAGLRMLEVTARHARDGDGPGTTPG